MRRPLAVFTLLLLTGCSPLNQENYAQLQPGMSKAEVERLLGGDHRCHADHPGSRRRRTVREVSRQVALAGHRSEERRGGQQC